MSFCRILLFASLLVHFPLSNAWSVNWFAKSPKKETEFGFVHRMIVKKLKSFERQYLVERASIQPLGCQVVDVRSGDVVGEATGLVDCVVYQVLDQVYTGEQNLEIRASLKFLKAPAQQTAQSVIRWRPIILPEYMHTGVPGTSLALYLMRMQETLKSWQNTDLSIEFVDRTVPLEWLIDDLHPGLADLIPSPSIRAELNAGRPGMRSLNFRIETQFPGQDSAEGCRRLKALPNSIKRMCAELKVYIDESIHPALYAVAEYGYRKSPAEVQARFQVLKQRIQKIVAEHKGGFFWSPPTDRELMEMAERLTPETLDMEFQLNPSIQSTWRDQGLHQP